MSNPFRHVTASLLATVPLFAAHAQEPDADPALQLQPVTVTATKRAQDPFDVPGTLEVATPGQFGSRGFTTLDRIDRIFGDVNIRARSSRAYSNITIRGQSSPDFYNPSAQLYVDGLPQDPTSFGQLLPQGLERVELLYGPQGTLYGRGAIGGVINVVTRKPDETFRADASGTIGNGEATVGVLLNAPLVENRLFGDLALTYRDQPGDYESLATGETVGGSEEVSGRARLRYAPVGSPWDVMATASTANLDSDEEQFVPQAFFDQRKALPVPSSYRLTTESFGLNAAYDLGPATITALTGYQDRDLDRTILGNFTPELQTTFSQELRLASNPAPGNRIDYLVGAFYQNLDFTRDVPAASQTSKQTIDSYALFGELTWHVTERFDITPGLRFDYEEVEAKAEGAVTLTGRDDFSAVSPKLALGYRLSDEWRVYALYSSGFKAGGFTRNVSPENIAFTYDPQRTDNVELGAKYRALDGMLEAGAAVYYNYTDDYQLFVGTQPFQYLQNVGEVEAYGLDLNVTWRPVELLQLTAAAGLNDTRFVEYDNPANPGVDLTDDRLPYAPPVTANLGVSYLIELSGELGALIPHGGLTYVGKTYFDESNTVGQDDYALFDAGITWAYGEHLTADLFVDNITDETYATYGFNGGPELGNLYQLGQGRTVGVRVSMSW